ncbi:hypothetical protein G7046_g10050 [Stylonectria norvegica]|nr:hypothetical protein G7046_g10050 [Stylonectria norvegica]
MHQFTDDVTSTPPQRSRLCYLPGTYLPTRFELGGVLRGSFCAAAVRLGRARLQSVCHPGVVCCWSHGICPAALPSQFAACYALHRSSVSTWSHPNPALSAILIDLSDASLAALLPGFWRLSFAPLSPRPVSLLSMFPPLKRPLHSQGPPRSPETAHLTGLDDVDPSPSLPGRVRPPAMNSAVHSLAEAPPLPAPPALHPQDQQQLQHQHPHHQPRQTSEAALTTLPSISSPSAPPAALPPPLLAPNPDEPPPLRPSSPTSPVHYSFDHHPQHHHHHQQQQQHSHHHLHPSSPPLRKDTSSSISTQATSATLASTETNNTSYSADTSPNLHQSIFSVKDGTDVSNNRRTSRRRTGPLSQQSRERAALIRKLGACNDCLGLGFNLCLCIELPYAPQLDLYANISLPR